LPQSGLKKRIINGLNRGTESAAVVVYRPVPVGNKAIKIQAFQQFYTAVHLLTESGMKIFKIFDKFLLAVLR